MGRRRQFGTKKRKNKEEREFLVYIKVGFILEKRPQTGSGAVSRIIAHLLENVGYVIGL